MNGDLSDGIMCSQINISMKRLWIYLTLLSSVTVITVLTASDQLCPKSCSCLGSLVDCSKRRLTSVPTQIPEWCELLELSHNTLYKVQINSFNKLKNLVRLDLSNTHLSKIDTDYMNSENKFNTSSKSCPPIQELKLNDNELEKFPELNCLSNLRRLVLHNNKINSLNNVTIVYHNIESIDLSINHLISIPKGFFSNSSSKLSSLNLSNNRITTIEKEAFDNLTSLEVLRLSKNKISTVPKELFRKLQSLKELDLSRNRLQSLEGLIFHGLDSLKVLKLRKNQLTKLFDGAFYGLNSIEFLHLDHNNISEVRKGWLYGLSSLNTLTLTHNSIDQIEGDGLEFSSKLLELDLSRNRLHSISDKTFSRLHSLQYLILDHNSISFIDDSAFRSLSSLELLDLNHNQISWTIEDSSGSFLGLDRLRVLGLAFNYIKSISKSTFSGLTSLETLDLSDNPIASIQDQSFSMFGRLKSLRLNTTDLLCDCTLKWFPIWLKNRTDLRLSNETKCKHPQWLIHSSLLDVNPEEFRCEDYLKPYLIDDFKTLGNQPITALKGDNKTLSCRAASSSVTPMQFQWRKNNEILNTSIGSHYFETFAHSRNEKVTEYTGNLHLTHIQDEDEGRYQCIASNNFGAVYTFKIQINVHVMPKFTKTPSNVTVKAGNTARLECAASGQPLPEISWQKDGGDNFPAAMERRMHVMPADDVFFIVEVKVTDMGHYTCTATNDAGSVIVSSFLNVLQIPTFVRAMNDKEALEGETAVLECMASGSPKPLLFWKKDGLPIVITERHFFTADNQLLIIVKTKPSDEGEYSCEMTNILGTITGSSYLKIIPSSDSSDTENPYSSFNIGSLFYEDRKTIGIIIISVFICIVFTSFIWVIIIYHTRKRSDDYSQTNTDDTNIPEFDSVNRFSKHWTSAEERRSNIFTQFSEDMVSVRSDSSTKDSGTGDSARRDSSQAIQDDYDEGLKSKRGLLKGMSLDQINVKRNHKQTPNLVINPLSYSPIKSFSVSDMSGVKFK